jgi:hypothetical protein
LLVGAFLCFAEWSRGHEISSPRNALVIAGGGMIGLAMMARPDAVLAIPAAGTFFLLHRVDRRRKAACLLLLTLPIAAVFLPYFFWRLSYYGHLFPNTYYAKSASLPYFGQGLIYLWEFTRRYFLWAFAPLLLAALWKGLRNRRASNPLTWMMALYCLLHTLYVVRVGGDFMEGRFFVPVLPFLYLLIEKSMRELTGRRIALGLAFAALVLSVAVNREVIEPRKIRQGITDERSWVPMFRSWYREGAVFGRHLPTGTVIATDAVGAFGYSSRFPIVDTVGLVDETVAHQPLSRRSRPGHEKAASLEYLASRDVAVIRDGMSRYFVDQRPALRHAGNRYFMLTDDRDVVAGFQRAVAELMSEGR